MSATLPEIEAAAAEVVRRLREAGHEAFFAGGSVRDRLLGRPVTEVDVATGAKPGEIEKVFPGAKAIGRAFGVMQVEQDGRRFEVATFRSDGRYLDGRHPETVEFCGREGDVRRRDFTINGMLYDPEKDEVIDLVGGRRDLEAKLVRTIGVPGDRFEEDHLRLMRAVRFACVLDFEIEADTSEAIMRLAPSIGKVSAERIAGELRRILLAPGRARGMDLLHQHRLLEQFLPEVAAMDGVPQPPEFHPEGDVWTHTKLCLQHLDNPDFALAMGTLLHDVGKPDTYTVEDRIRFTKHDKIGQDLAVKICRRLRLSRDETEQIAWLVGKHQVLRNVKEMRESRVKRLIAHECFDNLLALVRADSVCSHRDLSCVEFVEKMRAGMPAERPDPLLTGDDLIKLGARPGPLFGEILRAVYDDQLEGKVRTRDQAVKLARKALRKKQAEEAQ